MLKLEPNNYGKPINPFIEINPKFSKKEIPQAWEKGGNWFYNQLWAMVECGKRLPTKAQWDCLKEESPSILEGLPKNGFLYYRCSSHMENKEIGTYWSSTKSTSRYAEGNWYHLYSKNEIRVYENEAGYGFSVRCLKK